MSHHGGTFDYMAPELFEGGRASVASDIYAVGVLFHEMLTGKRPAWVSASPPLPAEASTMSMRYPGFGSPSGAPLPGTAVAVARHRASLPRTLAGRSLCLRRRSDGTAGSPPRKAQMGPRGAGRGGHPRRGNLALTRQSGVAGAPGRPSHRRRGQPLENGGRTGRRTCRPPVGPAPRLRRDPALGSSAQPGSYAGESQNRALRHPRIEYADSQFQRPGHGAGLPPRYRFRQFLAGNQRNVFRRRHPRDGEGARRHGNQRFPLAIRRAPGVGRRGCLPLLHSGNRPAPA